MAIDRGKVSVPRLRKEPPQEPPRHAKNAELGRSREERNRHLGYAHDQYSASGQGRAGAPKGRNLPLQPPPRNAERYPPGTKMPWPRDETIAAEDGPRRRPRRSDRS
jgi:hypothetical protein